MCIATAYLKKQGGREDVLLKEVVLIKSDGEGLLLRTLFGEEKSIKAKIKEVNFTSSRVLLEESLNDGRAS